MRMCIIPSSCPGASSAHICADVRSFPLSSHDRARAVPTNEASQSERDRPNAEPSLRIMNITTGVHFDMMSATHTRHDVTAGKWGRPARRVPVSEPEQRECASTAHILRCASTTSRLLVRAFDGITHGTHMCIHFTTNPNVVLYTHALGGNAHHFASASAYTRTHTHELKPEHANTRTKVCAAPRQQNRACDLHYSFNNVNF